MLLKVYREYLLQTLTILSNAHAVRGRPTLKDVERFRCGQFRELKQKTKAIHIHHMKSNAKLAGTAVEQTATTKLSRSTVRSRLHHSSSCKQQDRGETHPGTNSSRDAITHVNNP
jgi:hypothetical protein